MIPKDTIVKVTDNIPKNTPNDCKHQRVLDLSRTEIKEDDGYRVMALCLDCGLELWSHYKRLTYTDRDGSPVQINVGSLSEVK